MALEDRHGTGLEDLCEVDGSGALVDAGTDGGADRLLRHRAAPAGKAMPDRQRPARRPPWPGGSASTARRCASA